MNQLRRGRGGKLYLLGIWFIAAAGLIFIQLRTNTIISTHLNLNLNLEQQEERIRGGLRYFYSDDDDGESADGDSGDGGDGDGDDGSLHVNYEYSEDDPNYDNGVNVNVNAIDSVLDTDGDGDGDGDDEEELILNDIDAWSNKSGIYSGTGTSTGTSKRTVTDNDNDNAAEVEIEIEEENISLPHEFESNSSEEDDEYDGLCLTSLETSGARYTSTSHIWNKWNDRILDATHDYDPSHFIQVHAHVHAHLHESSNSNGSISTSSSPYQKYIHDLFTFYTPTRMRRSIGNPAPSDNMIKLTQKIKDIKKYNQDILTTIEGDEDDDDDFFNTNTNNEDDQNINTSGDKKREKKSLRVLVLGGSVTAGHGCALPEFLRADKNRHSDTGPSMSPTLNENTHESEGESDTSKSKYAHTDEIHHKDCAWAGRLEHLLNEVMFEGEPIVKIDNIAAGGQTSEWGAFVLKYRLFSQADVLPDVVISAYSANEALDEDPDPGQSTSTSRVFHDFIPSLIEAANDLHPCDDYAPLIIMADDFYGDFPNQALHQTGDVLMQSIWYNLMAVNYASVVRYKVLPEVYDYEQAQAQAQARHHDHHHHHHHPLIASKFTTHLGMAFHIGMAWTMLFNIINAFVEVCNDEVLGLTPDAIENYILPSQSVEARKGTADNAENDSIVVPSKQNSSGDSDLILKLQQKEAPTKYFSRVEREGQDQAYTVGMQVAKNIADRDAHCGNHTSINTNDTIFQPRECAYAWVSHQFPSTSFIHKEQLAEKMEEVIISNNGWLADGDPITNPRTGWYTYESNSSFTMRIENITEDTNAVIIYAMKSYGPKFLRSKLSVTTRAERVVPLNDDDNVSIHNFSTSQHIDMKELSETFTTAIDGYHDTHTSVHFPYTIPIIGGARIGDTVILNAQLVGGSHFKIAGIAFCHDGKFAETPL
mmetsp:Transcript_12817/g.19212  ORF Transcript_12817/g.19212 Transcript_12817/m.19212 type:complete len:931 (+) Transcript_12817:127-2919(+)